MDAASFAARVLSPAGPSVDDVTAAVAAGVNLNAQCGTLGLTAVHVAVELANAAVLDALVASGASIDALDNYGSTPLWYAAFHGTAEMVRHVIALGADVNLCGSDAGSPIMALLSQCHGRDAAARLDVLLACPDVDVDAEVDGITTLQFARVHGLGDAVEAEVTGAKPVCGVVGERADRAGCGSRVERVVVFVKSFSFVCLIGFCRGECVCPVVHSLMCERLLVSLTALCVLLGGQIARRRRWSPLRSSWIVAAVTLTQTHVHGYGSDSTAGPWDSEPRGRRSSLRAHGRSALDP